MTKIKPTLFKRICYWVLLIIIETFIGRRLRDDMEKKRSLKKRLKYFKPELHTSLFGKKIIWHEREKPLSDDDEKLID